MYRAEDSKLGCEVAIKVVPADATLVVSHQNIAQPAEDRTLSLTLATLAGSMLDNAIG